MARFEGVDQEIGGFEQMQPVVDEDADADEVELMVDGGERFEIGVGEFEEGGGGACDGAPEVRAGGA